MDDNHKKYKGIKFLKVEQQFLGAKKISNQSSKALSINDDLLLINQKKRNSVNCSAKSSVKSSAKKSRKSSAKKSSKNSKNSKKGNNSVSKKEKDKSKKKKYSDFDILKKLIELQKEQEKIIRENKLINKNDNPDNLNVKKCISSKNLNHLRKKIISFKSVIINNINNMNNIYNIKNKKEENKNSENNENKNKSNNNVNIDKNLDVKEKTTENKLKRFFCCL